MAFIANAEDVARSSMRSIAPALEEAYAKLIIFLAKNPESASAMRGKGKPEIGSEEYIAAQAQNFAQGRTPRGPKPPSTKPDEMVSFILEHYFNVPSADLARAKKEHLLSMAAENLVGDLLERYLASIMEPLGWIWCSGSMVKAVDFIKPAAAGDGWLLLQIKNRDNSENSSSSAIRNGTTIEKWFRTFAVKGGENWAAFPDTQIQPLISEAGFRLFVQQYLKSIKTSKVV